MKKVCVIFLLITMIITSKGEILMEKGLNKSVPVEQIFKRVRAHDFHPLNEENTMTRDRELNVDGIADLDNDDWQVRLLAVRDLVRAGTARVDEISNGLDDSSLHVRQVTAMALGILNAHSAATKLSQVLRSDESAVVRSQAAIALGQLESTASLDLLRDKQQNDPSRDVQHQCELAIYQIEKQMGVTSKQMEAFLSLDESTFESVKENGAALDFTLEDTEGKEWQLSQFRNKKWVVLIWVFADWCPVCHGEFHDLMKMQKTFEDAGIQVFTLEAHDTFRGRVMVGKELEPKYWFANESFKEAYTNQIWWPHLLDRAGAIGAKFGADPLAFSVHAEYINRPTTVIIDPAGKVRFIYQGTFWGDRPTIEQTLDMIKNESFEFRHQRRLNTEN